MSHQDILKKAIQKAVDNNWDNPIKNYEVHGGYIWGRDSEDSGTSRMYVNDLIFNHNFAKSLWPPDDETLEGYTSEDNPMWEYHLQMMVIAEDPIRYLGENI